MVEEPVPTCGGISLLFCYDRRALGVCQTCVRVLGHRCVCETCVRELGVRQT